ncbi:hypothetical protein IRJ41_013437 [Triplophysa rosa]|uniref:Uncharacterized protein n=1 Tax=Triplophysa rosa TaxID=992332 RepID=A0A9W7TQG6_TRIRA|nr:hypothetical protein IRJ41_013437 [Triplophysa rosa]
MVVAVEVSDSGIVFGKIVLILLDQNRVLLVLEKHKSVKLVDVGVHYLTREGDYICVDIDSLIDYYPYQFMAYVAFQLLPFITLFVFNFAGVTMHEAVMDAITAALPKLDEDRLKSLLERLLLVVGVEEVADLIYVKEDDIKDILTPLQTRKLIDSFKGECPSNWITTFQVPWEKMAPTLRDTISVGQRPTHSDRLQMIRIIVDAIRAHCPNPTKAECSQIAKNVVAQYPKSFGDVTDEGDLLGSGYTSLLNQIKTRVEHVNRGNTLARIRRPKRTNENNDDTSQHKNICIKVDSYGCINWQPHNCLKERQWFS